MTIAPPKDSIDYDVKSLREEGLRASTLEEQARLFAKSHTLIAKTNDRAIFLKRLDDMQVILQQTYQRFTESSEIHLKTSYAAEWMLDNFYIVQQAARQIREDMPSGYYKQLPKIHSLLFGKTTRIYAFVNIFLASCQAQVDRDRLVRFVEAYQEIAPLTTGELWALPVMLRYSILQCLTSAAINLTGIPLAERYRYLASKHIPYRRGDEMIVSFAILSLRSISAIDWKLFIEKVSIVDEMLRQDPAEVYPWMDFETRDHYRGVIENLALRSGYAEHEVAWSAIQLAQASLDKTLEIGGQKGSDQPPEPFPPRQAHVGYYLVDDGRSELEHRVGYAPSLSEKLRNALLQRPTLFYLGAIVVLGALFMEMGLHYTLRQGGSTLNLVLFGLLGFTITWSVSVGMVNWLVTRLIPPRILPKMDFERGIPTESRTIVVIPCLLSNADEVDSLLRQIELHYLGNDDPKLYFALLSDFIDAPQENMLGDKALLDRVSRGIHVLNRKHQRTSVRSKATKKPHNPFLLLHRPRKWNPGERCWMGWERKRGKLVEFNQFLMGASDPFSHKWGSLSVLPTIRYVITLDADTMLPRGAAQRLVATLAHPLNRASFNSDGQILSGYTILQPRVQTKPESINRSLLTRICSTGSGLDPYTLAISDVYQDLFGEALYMGKGIYEVTAFERSMQSKVPENTLLSHDLFEGIHGRVGSVTDISLFEDHPAQYLADASRRHRWARGDWQVSPWLLPSVPHGSGGKVKNELTTINRWKILDNLRRTLFPPSVLFMLIAGWMLLPGSALFWTLTSFLAQATPVLTNILSQTTHRRKDKLQKNVDAVTLSFLQTLLALLFLPYEAVLLLDAVGATLFRMLISHKRLLQWRTMAHTIHLFGIEHQLAVVWAQMRISSYLALLLALTIGLFQPSSLPVAAPFLLAWLFSPIIAHYVSQPLEDHKPELNAEQIRQLRQLACRTWLFFEHFVSPEDNWLPPDHFQEQPRGQPAQRTSPTNIGLMLASTLAAFDLGYIGPLGLSLRLEFAFEAMGKLERYRGHFLNWYETTTLQPLHPRYVSTVDSGNLAGCLLLLEQGIRETPSNPLLSCQCWQGLLDILEVLDDCLQKAELGEIAKPLREHIADMRQIVTENQDDANNWFDLLAQMRNQESPRLGQLLVALVEKSSPKLDAKILASLNTWAGRVSYHLDNLQREMSVLAPWLEMLGEEPELLTHSQLLNPTINRHWQAFRTLLKPEIRLSEVPVVCKQAQASLVELQELLEDQTPSHTNQEKVQETLAWFRKLCSELETSCLNSEALLIACQRLVRVSRSLFDDMDFNFLFEPHRQVFHIGYNLDQERLDGNYYDLLASEARLASYIAIIKGDIPQSHWLHLARPITKIGGAHALLSWSGTMFEYLMPLLFMHSYRDSLLDQSCRVAVRRQIAYGRQVGAPWGISEAGYYHFDERQNYQYKAFGVPGLGFKRDLGDDLVIAPYASLMALNIDPLAVLHNLHALTKLGALGVFGLYESLDFTHTRLNAGQHYQIVQSYYAHHQGMILLSLLNFLKQDRMVHRFHANLLICSADLLLHEFVPRDAPIEKPRPDIAPISRSPRLPEALQPWLPDTNAPAPQAHLLSNGRFGTLVTHHGSGYCTWQNIALTRWRAETTLDNWGTWIYIQDQEKDTIWSVTHQPVGGALNDYQVTYYHHKVEFKYRHNEITTRLEIVVAAEDDLEIRQLTIYNHSDLARQLIVLSYAEVVLAQHADDRRHPAFNKLFIESQYLPDLHATLFNRRPRSSTEQPVFLAHALISDTAEGEPLCICSRIDFLGRCGSTCSPAILESKPIASMITHTDLDPIMSLGLRFIIPPHKTVKIAFLTVASDGREKTLDLVRKYRNWARIDRNFEQVALLSERVLQDLEFDPGQIAQVQLLLSMLLYPQSTLRASAATLAANRLGQSGLWKYAISGDYPILLARISNKEESSLAIDLLKAHAYWRRFNLQIDLVFLNLGDSIYESDLHHLLLRLLQRTGADLRLNRRGGVFLLRAEGMPGEDRMLLETTARVILDGSLGPIRAQLSTLFQPQPELPRFVAMLPSEAHGTPSPLSRPEGLLFDNGFGGFSEDGKEYWIYLMPGEHTPAPWINVIANPEFGFTISEAGGGYTWAWNSGENRLTPWRNDPVADLPGETLYLRDEETGQTWSPTPLPMHGGAPYLARHGAGYTIFENNSHGMRQKLRLFALQDAPVKVIQLSLENTLERTRRVSATYYVEWVLGPVKETMQPYVLTEFDTTHHAILARNPYNTEFSECVAFVASTREPTGLTTDRAEFLGVAGDLHFPAALGRVGLKGTLGAGLDPCAALQNVLWIAPGEIKEITFLLGQGANREQTLELLSRYRDIAQIERGWRSLNDFWDHLLGKINVKTPELAMDILLNRWLLYQALSCRIWGRSALYQSSGAFGFRDQLQDVLCLLDCAPLITSEHILESARHQFETGDVLHWWHPPSGRGVRTRCSDDLLWLPYVTAHYVTRTGDQELLEQPARFLQGQPLGEEEHERYAQYTTGGQAPLFEHCRRALERGTTSGSHGLPLIGSHDWNDGMNRVGIDGQGESVWNAWFLYDILQRFARLCECRNQDEQAALYRQQAELLRQMAEQYAWDGNWYLRAFYDDGTPLGSAQNEEAQIDSLAQSWAVLSGAAEPQRARQAMHSFCERLVRSDEGIILLFTPPFDKSERDPGYIKGYAPGIRENGGQYTHAALWAIWAFAELGDGERAGELFRLINPIYHSDSPEKARHYHVEPYVVAADVYGAPPYTGRGGWTWYTGSASWMYRLGVEAILGVKRQGDRLRIDPTIPSAWRSYEIMYRFGSSVYRIRVDNPKAANRGIRRLSLDGKNCPDGFVQLMEDGTEHQVLVVMG